MKLFSSHIYDIYTVIFTLICGLVFNNGNHLLEHPFSFSPFILN